MKTVLKRSRLKFHHVCRDYNTVKKLDFLKYRRYLETQSLHSAVHSLFFVS